MNISNVDRIVYKIERQKLQRMKEKNKNSHHNILKPIQLKQPS